MATVKVEIDGKALLAADDGPSFVREAAIQELRLRHGYEPGEISFVEKDAGFQRGCETEYLRIRDAVYARERSDGRASDKEGGRASSAPYRWTASLAYERPKTRGMWNRAMKE